MNPLFLPRGSHSTSRKQAAYGGNAYLCHWTWAGFSSCFNQKQQVRLHSSAGFHPRCVCGVLSYYAGVRVDPLPLLCGPTGSPPASCTGLLLPEGLTWASQQAPRNLWGPQTVEQRNWARSSTHRSVLLEQQLPSVTI